MLIVFCIFTDLSFAKDIVELLGGFPLALSNAAAYIISKQITFKTYYERITRDERGNDCDASGRFINTVGHIDISKRVGLEYKNSNTVFTWILSHGELSPNAVWLLTICAFLSNDDIPIKILNGGPMLHYRGDWLSKGTCIHTYFT